MQKETRKIIYGGAVIHGEKELEELFGDMNKRYQRFVVLTGKHNDDDKKHILSILCLEKDVWGNSDDDDVKKLSIDTRYNRDNYYVPIAPLYKHMVEKNMNKFDFECLNYIKEDLSYRYTFFHSKELVELMIHPTDVDTLARFASLEFNLRLDEKKFDKLMKDLYKNDEHNMKEYEYYKELKELLFDEEI